MQVGRYLGCATKELTQDSLLDIIQLPDAGCYASCQLLVDVRICSKRLRGSAEYVSSRQMSVVMYRCDASL